MSFGSNLERIRKDRKMSQAELGKVLGLTQQMISSYENDSSSPNVEILTKIADYFHVSIDDLVDHIVKSPNQNSPECRLNRYFQKLTEKDQERSILIIRALLEDRRSIMK
ncbi:MAG: helix-turn-helix domain-containing protein [Lachnospiraceae bacterium]|nr:helix-turn-helix domain-containing protein [Lachnospiraceae bacterium]